MKAAPAQACRLGGARRQFLYRDHPESTVAAKLSCVVLRQPWLRINAALRAGIGRSVIESLECPPWLIRRTGLGPWLDFEGWARPLHRSGLYRFLAYLLPSQEELRQEAPRCAA